MGPGPSPKRALTNKRVSNRKLREELGYIFKYPTFRQGYAAEIGLALGCVGIREQMPDAGPLQDQ